MMDIARKILMGLVFALFAVASFAILGSRIYGVPFNWCPTKNYFLTITAPAQGAHGNLVYSGQLCSKQNPVEGIDASIRKMLNLGEKDGFVIDFMMEL